jgi:hypothetical protein
LLPGRDDPSCIGRRQRLGQRFRLSRRAQGGSAGSIGQPAAFEKPQERADARQPAPKRARPRPACTAEGQKAAQIGRAQGADIGYCRRAAAVTGQELQELTAVAFIGIDGQRRKPPLLGQHLQPCKPRRLEVGSGRDEEFLHWQRASD